MIKIPSVRRYKDLNTNIDDLYDDIVEELQKEKELNIVNEMEGTVKDTEKPFKTVTAVRQSIPRVFVGALREVTVTITGEADDHFVEVHTGAWLRNLAMPGAGGLLIAGPLGAGVAAGASGLVAANYQRKLWKKINELVNKNSKKELSIEKVEDLPSV